MLWFGCYSQSVKIFLQATVPRNHFHFSFETFPLVERQDFSYPPSYVRESKKKYRLQFRRVTVNAVKCLHNNNFVNEISGKNEYMKGVALFILVFMAPCWFLGRECPLHMYPHLLRTPAENLPWGTVASRGSQSTGQMAKRVLSELFFKCTLLKNRTDVENMKGVLFDSFSRKSWISLFEKYVYVYGTKLIRVSCEIYKKITFYDYDRY